MSVSGYIIYACAQRQGKDEGKSTRGTRAWTFLFRWHRGTQTLAEIFRKADVTHRKFYVYDEGPASES